MSGFRTDTSTVPLTCGGTTALKCVVSTQEVLASVSPKRTTGVVARQSARSPVGQALENPVPVTVMVPPPVEGPEADERDVTVG